MTTRRQLGPRRSVAQHAATMVNSLSRRLGRGSGTVAGGRVGLALDPRLLEHQLAHRDVFLVSGTNGKTTTTAMLRAALGPHTVSNETGSNMPAGIVAALCESDAPIAVLEVDESWLGAVVDASHLARSCTVVLLNLSRDQLDRSSEVRQLALKWRAVLSDAERAGNVTVVANVNDPLVAYAVENASNLVACVVPIFWRLDSASCPRCTRPLDVDVDGSWLCQCGFDRPVAVATLADTLDVGSECFNMDLSLPGSFNRANAALAVTAAHVTGVEVSDALSRVSAVDKVAGRFDVRTWRGREFRLMLAKNPAGVAALLDSSLASKDDVVVAINDRVADGHDPSWIYDAPFELLRGRRVWCAGTRALDIATRLECDGVDVVVVEDDATFPSSLVVAGPIDVIANYTAFTDWVARSATP